MVDAPRKRGFVATAKARGLSERQACRLARLSRSGARYRARAKRGDETNLVERLKEIARKKRRRGYRLAYWQLRREGIVINHKRVHRLWKAAGVSVPKRKSRKRVRGARTAREIVADAPNVVWCLDFAQEAVASGKKVRILCVSDEFTRESLAIEVSGSFVSQKVCQVLERLFTSRGKPAHLRMDNGPEFIALALRGLCYRFGVNGAYIEPGKPWQNGFAESFVSRLRDEFLDGEALWSVKQAQTCLGSWRRY